MPHFWKSHVAAKMAAAAKQVSISVLSDDTAAFVLLLYNCFVQKLKLPVIMESPIAVPKLAPFSPTTEAFKAKRKQTHDQACVWKPALIQIR